MALITFTDLAFGWSTTLDVLSSEVHRIVQRWSWPWSWFWPSAVPSLDLVDATRFFRITETEVISEDASRFGQWWPFVMASIAIYGFVPRAVSYWIASQRCARAVGVASQTNRHASPCWNDWSCRECKLGRWLRPECRRLMPATSA